MLNFPDNNSDLTPEKPSLTLFDAIFSLITILASTFSGYTTYLGFSYDFPIIPSLIMAIIIGCGLLLVNFRIREDRIKGNSIVSAFIAFSIFFVFSFISNTNAIYTYFLSRDIVGETQVAAWHTFDIGTTKLLGALNQHNASSKATQTKKALDLERTNLQRQITDPENPGMGRKARAHLQQIETILDVQLTELQAPGFSEPLAKHQEYADTLDKLILKTYNDKFKKDGGHSGNILRLIDKIKKLRRYYEDKVYTKKYFSDTTDLMYSDLKSLTVETRQLVGFKGDIQNINISADDIGSFQYTWKNFWNGIRPPAIILSILLSIMLDILTPTLSVLLYKQRTNF